MGKRILRKAWPILIGVAVVGAIVYAFLPQPIEVDGGQVTRGPLRVTVDREGKTRVKERYIVSAPLAGRLHRIQLRPGDKVAEGKTLVAVIEPGDPSLLDARARAEAIAREKAAAAAKERSHRNLERAKVAEDYAQAEYNRAKRLAGTGGVTQQHLENTGLKLRTAEEELKSAQFAVQIAAFELEQAQAALLYTRPRSPGDPENPRFDIRSPINGCVLGVIQESSKVVGAGTELLTVGDPANLECVIDVLSTEAVQVQRGAKVLLEHWGGNQPLLGRVRLVEPAAFTKVSSLGVEEQRVNIIVDFADPPEKWKALGDGYRVEARIIIWEGDHVLKVPAGALFRHADGWAVFRATNGKAELRPVRIGHNNGLEAEVHDGLAEGDRLIVYPSDRIKDGVAVLFR